MSQKKLLLDGSKILVESCVRAGADIYIGYPITPSNWIYRYSLERFSSAIDAPDEISVLQWMAGVSTTGRFPVTATSFPGFALMLESINMAYMMELPMLIILAQRLGPSTGSATQGAQGDLLLMRGAISGGFSLPVFCPSNFEDLWYTTYKAVNAARKYRSPVVLLTSKEMVMTQRTIDISSFKEMPIIKTGTHKCKKKKNCRFEPYGELELGGRSHEELNGTDDEHVPAFLPAGNPIHQTRFNASTHGKGGLIQKATAEAMENTKRLEVKIREMMKENTSFCFKEGKSKDRLLVTYGVTSYACRDALEELERKGINDVSLLIVKSLLPVPENIKQIIHEHGAVYFAEENHTGALRRVLFGENDDPRVHGINTIGRSIKPEDILRRLG